MATIMEVSTAIVQPIRGLKRVIPYKVQANKTTVDSKAGQGKRQRGDIPLGKEAQGNGVDNRGTSKHQGGGTRYAKLDKALPPIPRETLITVAIASEKVVASEPVSPNKPSLGLRRRPGKLSIIAASSPYDDMSESEPRVSNFPLPATPITRKQESSPGKSSSPSHNSPQRDGHLPPKFHMSGKTGQRNGSVESAETFTTQDRESSAGIASTSTSLSSLPSPIALKTSPVETFPRQPHNIDQNRPSEGFPSQSNTKELGESCTLEPSVSLLVQATYPIQKSSSESPVDHPDIKDQGPHSPPHVMGNKVSRHEDQKEQLGVGKQPMSPYSPSSPLAGQESGSLTAPINSEAPQSTLLSIKRSSWSKPVAPSPALNDGTRTTSIKSKLSYAFHRKDRRENHPIDSASVTSHPRQAYPKSTGPLELFAPLTSITNSSQPSLRTASDSAQENQASIRSRDTSGARRPSNLAIQTDLLPPSIADTGSPYADSIDSATLTILPSYLTPPSPESRPASLYKPRNNPRNAFPPKSTPKPDQDQPVLDAPALLPSHYSCYNRHTQMPPSGNSHHPIACMTCKKADAGNRWKCAWCCLRVCGTCMERLDKAGRRGRGPLTLKVTLREGDEIVITNEEGGGILQRMLDAMENEEGNKIS